MTEDSGKKEIPEMLEEVVSGAKISFTSKVASQALESVFTYAVTAVAGASVYGTVSVLNRLSRFAVFALSGIGTAVHRTVPREKTSSQNFIISTSIALTGILSTIIGINIVLFDEALFEYTFLSDRSTGITYLFAAGVLLSSVLWVSADALKALKRVKLYNSTKNVFRPVSKLCLALTGLFVFSKTAAAAWGGVVAASGLSTAVTLLMLDKRSSYSISESSIKPEKLKEFISFAGKATATSITENTQLSIFFVALAVYLSPVEAGGFSTALVLGSLVRFPLLAANQIFPPIASKLYDKGRFTQLKDLYSRSTKLAIIFSMPIAFTLAVYSPQIMRLFSSNYSGYAVLLMLTVSAKLVATSMGSVGVMLSMTDNESAKAKIQGLVTILTVILCVYLTLNHGVVGLALAFLLRAVINNTAETVFLHVREGIHPYRAGYLKALSLGLACLLTNFAASSLLDFGASLASTGLIWIIYSFAAWKLLDEVDRDVVRTVLKPGFRTRKGL